MKKLTITYKNGFSCPVCMEKISVDEFIWSTSKQIYWNIENNDIYHTACMEKEEVEEQMQRDNYADITQDQEYKWGEKN